jgi:lysophospholipase L1-like esterase
LADRPRVVLLGDSIRLAYQPLVAGLLAGEAEVGGPAENGGDSAGLLRRLRAGPPLPAALVVFNAGLHDLRRSGAGGGHRVEVATYEANLAAIVGVLRSGGSSALFATTTPVDDARHAGSGKPTRLDADVRRYNDAARRAMTRLEVPVVDLYDVLAGDPALLDADGVHLTAAGAALAAGAVAAAVRGLL